MTVTTTTARNVKAPNGSTTSFPTDFAFEADGDLVVTRVVTATSVETLQTLTTDYTVTGGGGSVGTIEMVAPPPGPGIETLVIERDVAFTQSADYQRNDPFPAEVNETALDKLTFLVQQVLAFIQRAILLPKNTTLTDITFPVPVALKAFRWNAAADGLEQTDDPAVSAAAAATSETNAASSASAASTSESNASSSASAASTSATNASTAETNAETAETNAETAETNAETAETNAASSASAASTSETNAASSASAASTSATNAATSETNAETAETNAETAETNAETAETNAANTAQSIGNFRFTFDVSTSMGDPGAGDIRVNNAAFASVTAIALDATSADTGNPDISDFVAAWGASTSTIKGQLTLRNVTDPANFATYNITAAVTDNTGWLQIAVDFVDSGGSLFSSTDPIVVNFTRSGDAGTADGTLFAGDTAAAVAATVNSSVDAIAIGDGTAIAVTSPGALAIGDAASIPNAFSDQAIAIGAAAVTSGAFSVAIGNGAVAQHTSPSNGQVVFGPSARCGNASDDGIAIGPAADCFADRGVAIGAVADVAAGATGSIAIGDVARVTGTSTGAISIGDAATAAHTNSIAFGAETDTRDAGDVVITTSNSNTFQGHLLLPWLSTSGSSATAMNMGPGTNPGFLLATETAYGFKGIIIARNAANAHAMWEVKGLIERTTTVTTLLFSTVTKLHDDTGGGGHTLTVNANDTNETLEFIATGRAGTVTRWSGNILMTEVVH